MVPNAFATLAGLADRAVNSPDVARACRSVSGLMVPLLLAAAGLLGPGTPIPLDVLFVALAAQSLAGVDIRGPYPLRLGFLLAMLLVMTGATALGEAVGPHPAAAALAAGLVAVVAGALRHLAPEYGPMLSAPVGLTFLIAAFVPAAEPGSHAVAVLAGAGWAVVVQVALWPVRAQHPLRQAAGDAWQAAAALFDAMAEAGLPDGTNGDNDRDRGDNDHDAIVDGDGRPGAVATAGADLRTALESAYATLEAAGKSRPMRAQLDAAVQAAGRLGFRAAGLGTALEALVDRQDVAALNSPFQAAMEALAGAARAIGLAVVSRQPAHLAACEVGLQRAATLLAALRAAILRPGAGGAGPSAADQQAASVVDLVDDQLADALLALVALTDRAGERAVFPLELFDVNTWRLRPLAAALNLSPRPDPALVRFTLRLAVLMAAGVLAGKRLPALLPGHPLAHAYWLPFTILVVSQTDYGATRKRAFERLVGTLIGGAVGGGLLLAHPPRPALFAAAGAAGFLFAFYLRRQYRVAVVFITILVVVLTEMNHPTTIELTAERLGLTAVGGAVALAAALLFWPAWERHRSPALLAAALRANRDYVREVAGRLRAGGAYAADEVRHRRAAERANAAALASLARQYADPANRRAGVERAAVLANGNGRLTRLLGLLLLRATPAAPPDASPGLAAFAADAAAALDALASAVEADGTGDGPPAPAGPHPAAAVDVADPLLGRARTELEAMRLAAPVTRPVD